MARPQGTVTNVTNVTGYLMLEPQQHSPLQLRAPRRRQPRLPVAVPPGAPRGGLCAMQQRRHPSPQAPLPVRMLPQRRHHPAQRSGARHRHSLHPRLPRHPMSCHGCAAFVSCTNSSWLAATHLNTVPDVL